MKLDQLPREEHRCYFAILVILVRCRKSLREADGASSAKPRKGLEGHSRLSVTSMFLGYKLNSISLLARIVPLSSFTIESIL